MVRIRKMRSHEYEGYYNYFVEDYSKEIVENYGYQLNDATEQAKKELLRSFPNGINDDNDILFCIDTEINGENRLIGYLWYKINETDKSVFINDFYIKENSRGRGNGTLAIKALEKKLLSIGVSEIKLRVAFNNKRALKLYEKVGFRITGYNMSKNIDQQNL